MANPKLSLFLSPISCEKCFPFDSCPVRSIMQPLSSWHLLLLLFITSSIADWSLDSPSEGGGLDEPASQLRLDGNLIVPNAVTDGFSTGTTDGVPNLAQVPQDENVAGVSNVGNDLSTFEVASGCSSPSSPGKKRHRVRRGDSTSCPSGYSPSQFKKPTEPDPETKKAPSANASPRKFIPKLSPEAEHLSRVFLPKESRPMEDDYTCRKEGFLIAVCAREDSELQGQSSVSFVNFLDPCFPCTSFFLTPPFPPPPQPARHHNNKIFRLYLRGCMDLDEEEETGKWLRYRRLTTTQFPNSDLVPPY